MKRLLQWAARLYPAAWRARYGEEYQALIEQMRPGWRDVLDTGKGALLMQARTWNFLRTVGVTGLVGAIVAAVIAFRMPAEYVSSGVLKLRAGGDASTAVALYPQAFSRAYLHKVIRERHLYSREIYWHPMEDIVERMRHNIVLTPEIPSRDGQQAVRVRFSYPDAALAQRANNDLLARLSEMQARLQGATVEATGATLPAVPVQPGRGRAILCGLVAGLLLGAIGASFWWRPAWTLRVAAVGLSVMLIAIPVSLAIPERYISNAVVRAEPGIAQMLQSRANLTVTPIVESAGHDVLKLQYRDHDRREAQRLLRETISALVVDYAGQRRPLAGSKEHREFLAWRSLTADTFEVIDQPSFPEQPVSPNRTIIAVTALMLGTVLGVWLCRNRLVPLE